MNFFLEGGPFISTFSFQFYRTDKRRIKPVFYLEQENGKCGAEVTSTTKSFKLY